MPRVEREHSTGDLIIQISSSGNIPSQKIFLQSAYFKHHLSLTVKETNNLDAVKLNTGAFLTSQDRIHLSKLPRATIFFFSIRISIHV